MYVCMYGLYILYEWLRGKPQAKQYTNSKYFRFTSHDQAKLGFVAACCLHNQGTQIICFVNKSLHWSMNFSHVSFSEFVECMDHPFLRVQCLPDSCQELCKKSMDFFMVNVPSKQWCPRLGLLCFKAGAKAFAAGLVAMWATWMWIFIMGDSGDTRSGFDHIPLI